MEDKRILKNIARISILQSKGIIEYLLWKTYNRSEIERSKNNAKKNSKSGHYINNFIKESKIMATTSPRGDIDLTNDGPNRMNTVGSRFDSSSATLNNMLRTQSKFKFTQSKNKEITENLIEESSKKSLMLTFPKSSSDRNIYFQELKRKTKPFSSPK